MGQHLVPVRYIVESLTVTRAFDSILFIFEWGGGPMRLRKHDHAYSKNLEGNALRETYPDLLTHWFF